KQAGSNGRVKAAPVVSLALAIDHVVYAVEPIPAGECGVKAFRLAKKSADGAVYDLLQTAEGTVECDCPSYETTFRGTCGQCKHGRALVQMGLSARRRLKLAPVPSTADAPTPESIVTAYDAEIEATRRLTAEIEAARTAVGASVAPGPVPGPSEAPDA